MRFQHRPGESKHSPSGKDERILSPPIGLEEVTIGLMNAAVYLQSQPTALERDIEVVDVVLHGDRDVAPPSPDVGRTEQPVGSTLCGRPWLVA